MPTLYIYTKNPALRALYQERKNFQNDAGVDLYVPTTISISPFQTTLIDLEIKCKMVNEDQDGCGEETGYFLYPRSSIIKTPLLLANSVGVVDIGYRNTVKAAFRFIPFEAAFQDYTIEPFTRLVQIVSPDMKPIRVEIKEEDFEETERGTGGFGSTGK